jgi:HK97 family phage portal protein
VNYRHTLADAPDRARALLRAADDTILGAGTVLAPARQAKAAGPIVFPAFGGGSPSWGFGWDGGVGPASTPFLAGTLPGANQDRDAIRDAGDPWLNPVVAAGIGWIGDNFGEPEATVQSLGAKGVFAAVPDHDLVRLLETPNPEYDADALWFATVLAFVTSRRGSIWIKARSKAGRTLELWWVPPWEIRPVWGADGQTFIRGYIHTVDGREYPLQKEDVVHFRRGLNPANVRESLPHLDPVLAEIGADNAGTLYSGAILRNMGMPGVLITPADRQDEIDGDEQEAIKTLWVERTTGRNRGKPLVNSVPLKVERLSMSPEDLALRDLRDVPEARICAALKLSPMVLGLPSAKGFATFANYEQAIKAAYLGCLVPLQKTFAKAITRQLLPDLGGRPGRDYFEWSYENVPALAEDQDKRAARAGLLFEKGVIKRGKACELVGVVCPPEEDVYVFDAKAAGGSGMPVVPAAAAGAGNPLSTGKGVGVASATNGHPRGVLALPAPAAASEESREAGLLALAETVLRRVEGELDGLEFTVAHDTDAAPDDGKAGRPDVEAEHQEPDDRGAVAAEPPRPDATEAAAPDA